MANVRITLTADFIKKYLFFLDENSRFDIYIKF